MAVNSSTPLQATQESLWTLDFVLVILVGHFLFAAYTSLLTVVPPYVLHRGGQEWQLGLIIGSFGIVGIFIRPLAGRWINSLGAKRVALMGISVFVVGTLLHIAALSAWWLIPIRMLQGIGIAVGPVATSTMVANLAPAARRAEAMGYMGTSINVSFFYAPVTASWILDYGGFHNAFLFSAVCATLAMILASRISRERTSTPIVSASSDEKVPLISRPALFPTLVFLTYTFTTAPQNTFLPLLAAQKNLGNPGWFYTMFAFVSMVTMLASGPIADRLGRASVIIPGLLAVSAAMFVMSGAFFQLMFLSAGFLAGLGFGLLQPGIQSYTIDRVPPRERGAGMATLQQAWDVGGSGGAFILGPVGGVIGAANTFAITGVGALIGVTGFIIGNAKKPAALPAASTPSKQS